MTRWLVLIFWLGTLEFKILKYLFVCYLNIFLDNFPRFSVHKSLKILDKYIANFFNQCYGQNLAAVSTNVSEFVSGPILVVAVREIVWELLKVGLISGYKFHDLRAVMTNTLYSEFVFLEQLFSLINNRNVDIAYNNRKNDLKFPFSTYNTFKIPL